MNDASIHIAAVERETGLSKDVLRAWERRYGFPTPHRDAHGERSYSADHIDQLRLLRRLVDQGHRPGSIVGKSRDALTALINPPEVTPEELTEVDRRGFEEPLRLIRAHDATGFMLAMQQRLARDGLSRFVRDGIAPLTRLVGMAWEKGRFEIFEEHLYTELATRLLRQAIASLPSGQRSPRILLTTVSGEPHALGLLMLEALLALENAECIPLGPGMPTEEIRRAAEAYQVDVVAVSFSAAYPRRQLAEILPQLRAALASPVALWAGGSGVARLPPLAGIELLGSLEDAVSALATLRAARQSPVRSTESATTL